VAYDAAGRMTMTRRYAKVGNAGSLPSVPGETDLATLMQAQGYRNDALDEVTYRVYDRDGRVRLSIDGAGGVRETVYDSAGRVLREVAYARTLALGATLRDDLKTGTTTAASLSLGTLVSANDAVVRHVYDAAGQRRYSVDATGAVNGVWYDAAGRVVATRQFSQRIGLGLVTDAITQGQIDSAVGAGGATDAVELYVYDGAGRARYALRANGNAAVYPASQRVTETRYDAAGRVLLTQTYVASLMLDLTTAAKISSGNGVVSDLAAFVAANPATAQSERRIYDAAGRVDYVIDGTGAYMRHWYDAADRLFETRRFAARMDLTGITDATRVSDLTSRVVWGATDEMVCYVFDAAGRQRYALTSVGAPLSAPLTLSLSETVYDGADRVLATRKYASLFTADATLTGKLGAGTAQVSDFSAFANANAGTAQIRRTVYDAAGRATYTIDGTGAYSRVWRDGADRIVADRTFATRLSAAALAALNDATTVADLTALQTWTDVDQGSYRIHDAAGRVRFAYNSAGQLQEMRYDGVGRALSTLAFTVPFWGPGGFDSKLFAGTVTEADFSAFTAANAGTAQIQRTVYDASGNAVFSIDGTGAYVRRWHDGMGRETAQVRFATRVSLVGVDDASTVAQLDQRLTWPAENETSYRVYDAAGQVRYTVQLTSASTASVTQALYDGAGRRVRERAYTATMAFDQALAAKLVTGTALDADFASFTTAHAATAQTAYTAYDAAGQVRHAIDGLGYVTQSTYDGAGRLLSRHTYRNAIALTAPLTAKLDAGTATDVDIATAAGAASTVAPWSTGFDGKVIPGLDLSGLDPQGTGAGRIENDRLIFARVASPSGFSQALVWGGGTYQLENRMVFRAEVTTDASQANNFLVMRLRRADGGENEGIQISNGKLYTYRGPNSAVHNQLLGDVSAGTTYVVEMETSETGITTYVYAKGAARDSGYRFTRDVTSSSFGDFKLLLQGRSEVGVSGASLYVDNLAILNGNAVASESYRYNAAGQVIAKVDGLGNTETYGYDAVGRRVSVTDANGHTSRVVYDAAGNVAYSIDPTGAFTRTWYNAVGQAVSTRKFNARFDPATLSDATTATQLDNQLGPIGAWSARYQHEYRIYDTAGQLRITYDVSGHVTQYEYDAAGRQTTTRRYPAVFQTSDSTLLNRLFAGTASHADFAAFTTANEATARVESNIYDAAGRVSYVLQRSSGQWTVAERAYDGIGRTIAETRYGVSIAYTPGQSAGSVIAALQAQFSADPAIAATQSRTTRYLYDSAGQTRFVLDPTFAVSEQRYDGAGRVVETRNYGVRPNGIGIDTASVAAWASSQVSANVRKVTNTYDVAGRLTARTDALNNSESFTYDGADRMLTRTNRMGAVWTYQYDAAGRRTAEISPEAQVYGITAQGVLSVATRSVVTRYAYDALGQVTSKTEDADNAAGKRTTSYAYDKVGRLVKTTLPHPGSIDPATGNLVYIGPAPTAETTYDALGNAVVQKDANNHYSYRIYDGLGRVQTEIDQEHNVTTYGYNAYGEQVSLLRYAAKLVTTGAAFTSANWQAGKEITLAQAVAGVDGSNPQNRFIFTDYNQRGEKIEVRLSAVEYRNLDNSSVIVSGTPTTRYEYNAYGEVVREKVLQAGTGFWAETYRYYDRAGRMTHVVDAEGYMTEMQYNATGEVVKTIEYARTVATRHAPLPTITNPNYASYTGGLSLSLTLPPAAPAAGDAITGYNRETQWTYDVLGRKVSETLVRHMRGTNDAIQQQTLVSTYGYNAEDRVTTVTNASGTTTTAYNALGQVAWVREPARLVLSGTADTTLQNSSTTNLASSGLYELRSPYTTMAFDGLGRLIAARRHANGHDGTNTPATHAQDQVTLTVYDALDRVVMTQGALGWSAATPEAHRTYSEYDAAGNLTHSWSRLEGSTDSRDAMVHRWYSYDKTGRQTSASQTRVAIGAQAGSGTDQAEVVEYNAFGEIVRKTYQGVGGELLYTYDNAGRLVTDNSTGAIRKYAYNLAGQQIRETHWVKLDAATAAVQVATTMTVDGLGRTVNVVLPTHTTDPATTSTVLQSYDRWGNVVRVIDARGHQTDYEYNDQNQLVKETRPLVWVVAENGAGSWQRPVHYRYHDVQGRLVGTRDANGNLRQYSYDAVGQQVSVTDALNNVTRYAYDVFGHQRMSQDALGYIAWQEFDRADRVTAIGDFLVNGASRTRHARQSYVLNQHGDRLTVTNALNHTAKYDYDSQNRLIRSETAMGVVQGYAYDVMGRKVLETNALTEAVSSFTDRDGDQVRLRSLTWKYDVFGRVVDHNNLSGRDYDYAYDPLSGKMVSESAMGGALDGDSSSGYRDYTYYSNGLVRHVREFSATVAPQGFNTPFAEYLYEYDAAGNRAAEITKFKDAYGNQLHSIVRSEYDSNNRISRITQDDLDHLGNITKRNFELRYDYDLNGNRRRVHARSGYGDNLQGVPLENGAPTGPVSGNLLPSQVHDKWFTYDSENRVRIVNGELSGAAGAVGTVIRSEANSMDSFEHTYDQAGRVAWKVKRGISPFNGQEVITFERTIYNERGLLQHTYLADSTSASDNPYSSRYIYDAADQLIEMRRYAPDMFGNLAGAYGDKWINYLEARSYDADGRLLLQTTKVRNLAPLSALPEGPDDVSILLDDSRTEFIKQDGTSGYDAAGRVVAYRYAKKNAQSWRTDYYTTTYEGWESWQEKRLSGTSSDGNYRPTTNTLIYDPFGRLSTQVENTRVAPDIAIYHDRVRAYSYNGDGYVAVRRGGSLVDGYFTQAPDDDTGIRGNTLFIHAGGQQQAELAEGGKFRASNGESLVSQLTTLNGGSLYQAGGGVLVAVAGETLASMSLRAYGVDSYWYLIGDANGLSDRDAALIAGMQYRIPDVSVTKNDASTFRPYNTDEAIGGTQPQLPYIATPPKEGCNWLQIAGLVIFVVLVSIATVGVMTQPAVAAALGSAAPIVTGAAVGAAGSAAASFATTGSIDWRSVAAGAIAGALTAGLSTWAQGVGSIAAQAVRTVGTAAASYVGNKLAGVKNTHFSWKSVVANMVAADLSSAAGMGIDAVVANPQIADAIKQASAAVISARVRKDMGVDKKFDWAGVAQGVFQGGITALSSVQRQSLTPDQKKEYVRMVASGIPKEDALKYSKQTSTPIPAYLLRDESTNNPAFAVTSDDPFAFFRASANTAFSADAAISSDVLSSLNGGWPWDASSMNSVWGRLFNAGGGNVSSGGSPIRLRESLLAQARAIEPYAGVLMDKQDLGSVAGIRDYIDTYGDLAIRNRTAASTSRSIFAYESAARSDYRASVLRYARYKGYEMPNDWSSSGIADYVNRGYRNQSDMDVIRVVGEASPAERAYRNSLAMLDRGQGVGVIKPEFRARWQQSGGRVDTNRYYATEAEYRQFMKEESWRFLGLLSAGPAAGISMGLAAVSPLFAAGMTAYSFYSGGKEIQNGNLATGATEIALSMMGMRGLASQWSGVTGVRSALVNTQLLFGAAGRAGSSGVSVNQLGRYVLTGSQTRPGLAAAEDWFGIGRNSIYKVGDFVGVGQYKAVYRVAGNPDLVAAFSKSGAAHDLHHEAGLLKTIEEAGVPVIKSYGVKLVEGESALVMHNIEGAVSIKPAFNADGVEDLAFSRLGRDSISDLEKIRSYLTKNSVEDFQVLVAKNGRVMIHDPAGLSPRPANPYAISLIDDMLNAARRSKP
jgi:YD repeat-containing protein